MQESAAGVPQGFVGCVRKLDRLFLKYLQSESPQGKILIEPDQIY